MEVDGRFHDFFGGSDPEEFFPGCARMGTALLAKESGLPGNPHEL